MKKIFAVILTIALLSFASINTFAASPITANGGSDSAEVKGTYKAGSSAATVYSVEISWGSMEFTYTDASKGTWNPEDHKYDGVKAAEWSCAEGENKIEVKNHSNATVKVQLTYAPKSEYNKITGTFSDSTLNLASAEGSQPSNAPSLSATLNLDGKLSGETPEKTSIGTVTVTLAN